MRLHRLDFLQYTDGGRYYQGRRGILTVGSQFWPTIERWNLDTKLIGGIYTCEFARWTSKTGKQREAIRVLLTPQQFELIYPKARREELIAQVGPGRARGRIYIHPANYPHELEGCIAPGQKSCLNGVSDSVLALSNIFTALGGWAEGRNFDLEVG